jgi:glycosyltransferase involved in cell wall biosynthesis
VIDGGFPAERVSIVNNTFDTESLERHLGDTNPQQVAEWCREIEVDPHHTALFIGGLDRLKSLDFLVASATAARSLNRKFALIVGGSGPDQTHLIELQRRGLPIRVVGRLDGREKALALSSARVLAVPSQLGLVVIDSFVSGVPLITREGRLHGPEAEYLRPGEDSVWLARDTDPVRYAKEMVDIMSNGQALRVMSIKCRERAPEFTLGAMVEAFAQGVQRWAGLP